MRQVPRGPEDMNCPKWLSPMSEVCHKCPLWVKMKMAHPQEEGATIDEWNCAMAWEPTLLVAINNQIAEKMLTLQTEVEAMRNETKKAHDDQVVMAAAAIDAARGAIKDVVRPMFAATAGAAHGGELIAHDKVE